jgi:signal transduction histidine kinase
MLGNGTHGRRHRRRAECRRIQPPGPPPALPGQLRTDGRLQPGELAPNTAYPRADRVDDASARFTRQARRIVHEAGNPLTIIKGYLRILDGKLPPETDVRRELTVLGEEIERVSTIVRRMSEIPQILATEPALDIGDLLRELLTLYRETLFDAKGIAVETVLPGQAIPIACDRDSIKQILLNLWKNASEALSRGQRIRLSLSDDVVHQGGASPN